MKKDKSKTPLTPSPHHLITPPLLPSYGRRQGRRLRAGKRALMDGLLPKIRVEDWGIRVEPHDTSLNPESRIPDPLWLEIGFGGGEHLAHQAALHPDIGIIGCEPYINGIGDLLKKIEGQGLANIRIYPGDARLLIDALPAASLSRVFILYPDPWPKARHHKRRLISREFLDALARVMAPGALLRLATDHADYCAWMLERLLSHKDFRWTATQSADWLNPPPDWTPTRYEQKALAGRPTYLECVKQ